MGLTIEFSPEKTAINTGVSNSARLVALEVEQGATILDYGAGLLRNSRFLVEKGYDVAIFETWKQIERLGAEQLLPYRAVFHTELRPNESFEHILCTFVLNVLPTKRERIEVLYHLKDLLAENGTLYLEVRTPSSLYALKRGEPYLDGVKIPRGKHAFTFQKGFEEAELKQLLEGQGFKIKKMKMYGDSIGCVCTHEKDASQWG